MAGRGGRSATGTSTTIGGCGTIRAMADDQPTLYVCHGDDQGMKIHPCRRVQEALRAKGIPYTKVVAAHGNPFPFLRKDDREDLRAATGDTKLPTLVLADGTVLKHSKAINRWIDAQPSR